MKLFITKATCFILGFWILSNSLASLADRLAAMDVYGSLQAKELNTLLEKKDSIQAISLGNSHSGAIDFDTYGMEGQVLARAGTDLFEVKLYADSVAPLLPNLETVFIAISYFSFTKDNVLSEDTQNLRIELYGMLPTWMPLPGDTKSLILGKLHRYFRIMSIVRPDNWQNVFKNALENKTVTEYTPSWSAKTKTLWGECPHFTQDELDAIGNEIASKAANNHLKFLRLDPNIPVQSYQALTDTIEMLQNRGIRVVLFTPPYFSSYNERFYEIAPEMIESMHLAVDKISADYNVEYYDAASLVEFSTRPELFYNSDHLNECGMRAFSEYLKKEKEEQ